MKNKRKAFTNAIICFIMLTSAFPLFGQNIAVTYVKIKQDKAGAGGFNKAAEVIVNNSIKIRGIRVAGDKDGLRFKLPEYVSSKGKVYPQVILLNKQAEQVFKEALGSEKPAGEAPLKNTFRLGRYRIFDSPSALKAIARVVFDEAVEIECKIFDGENGLWVSWPSKQNPENGRWKKLVDISEYKLRESVERALFDRYTAEHAENE